jgi:hypothetical protein
MMNSIKLNNTTCEVCAKLQQLAIPCVKLCRLREQFYCFLIFSGLNKTSNYVFENYYAIFRGM